MSEQRQEEAFHVKRTPVTHSPPMKCSGCGVIRAAVLFASVKSPNSPRYCQLCVEQNVERKNARAREARQKFPKGADKTMVRRASLLWSAARVRAWRVGVPFSLSKKRVLDLLLAGKCQVTGLPFDPPCRGYRGNFIPSLDRLDPRLGYTDENARLVVWIYNAAKGPGTHEDVVRLADAIVSRRYYAEAAE